MNYGPPDHLAPCFLDLNWNQPVGRPHSADNLASGQLGTTPLSFPAMPFSADQGFVERAAMFSCFGGSQFGHMEAGKMSRDSSCHSLRVNGPQLEMPHTEDGNFPEESAAASDPISCEGNGKKRKTAPRGKGKETSKMFQEDDLDAKRCLPPKVEQNGSTSPTGKKQSKGKESNAEATEPQKDYIHVRARRGQATDSHSLAERVRREKISERMKLLQDIVPGCNKVTGKAIMLDEIINYVQSLQRQVEFLSMKLASVDTIETTATPALYSHLTGQGVSLQCSVNPLESLLHRTLNEFGNATSQLRNFWEDDLQNVMQMGYEQNQEIAFPSQGFHGM